MMDAGIGKAATAFGGTVAGEVAQAVNEGEDLTDALQEKTPAPEQADRRLYPKW